MTYEVRMTANAENDLRGIFEYIAFNLQSVENAVRQLDRLEHNIASLEQMPERFPVFREEPWRSRNLRIMPVDHYLVFYTPNPEERIVTVLRILYGRQDQNWQLNQHIPAMEEARRISRDPNIKGYTSIDELQKALEE